MILHFVPYHATSVLEAYIFDVVPVVDDTLGVFLPMFIIRLGVIEIAEYEETTCWLQ